MAIEKMVLLKVIGSLDNMHSILKELIFCENAHLNLNVENSNAYNNFLAVHQYESEIIGSPIYNIVDPDNIHNSCSNCLSSVEELSEGLNIKLYVDKKMLLEDNYSFEDAKKDLAIIQLSIGSRVREIKNKKDKIDELIELRSKVNSIVDKDVDFSKISNLNYFEYEIGSFATENKSRLKKNYEKLSAIVLKIGYIMDSNDDLYMIIYPKQFKEETDNLLKSLNWNRLIIPDEYSGTSSNILKQIDAKIEEYKNEIDSLTNSIENEKNNNSKLLLKIYNVFKLEDKIAELEQRADFGNNSFAVDVWVRESDKEEIENAIADAADKYKISATKREDLGDDVIAPTKLKNNWFSKPFEMIVNMYGLPAYDELDPTPFVAITFCLAFGIMFGDIGQGFIYVLAGLLLRKKMEAPAGLALRLGVSSMIFGCVYGSLFGLEKHELPWLPSLIEGGPLSPSNIPMILVAGVVFGIIVLTSSYVFGIINSLKNGDIEEGIFGKNGIVGYVFFISFILTIVALINIINIPMSIPVTFLLLSLVVLILKEPITNLVLNERPLFHHGAGAYLTESIFEAIETILGTLSNSISFVRVGAFALNHAGLFLAFLVISRMMPNIFLQIVILIIGNILILTLEGLVVLIQSLRLHYYEMFGKYFKGGGVAFKPIKLN
ncbi:V-type ATPase 116kDa subunit family protein [Sedimentibacter sp.]|uniref:V-type ATP synthase subunit I n=3 Tax=Sedimentibacter sp. TaxID=1960295 RepID=UPI0028A97ABD|nr:V-type ATPase 116kDa subunit family protein [Sedimentibacter sp.]